MNDLKSRFLTQYQPKCQATDDTPKDWGYDNMLPG
jgi:hypothetical protein